MSPIIGGLVPGCIGLNTPSGHDRNSISKLEHSRVLWPLAHADKDPLSSLVKTLRNAFSVTRTGFDDKQLNLNLNPHRFRLSPHSPTCLRQRVACSALHSSPRTTSRWTALQAKTTPRFKATVVTAPNLTSQVRRRMEPADSILVLPLRRPP